MRGRAIRWTLTAVLVATAGAAAVMAATGSTTSSRATIDVRKGTLGTMLVAANGHTLYRYTVDSTDVNRCSKVTTCNAYWPALLVKPGTKPTAGTGASARLVGTIGASNGMRQVTYAGFPLYFFSGDKKAGQTNGQAFGAKWYVVNVNGALVRHAVKATAPANTSGYASAGAGSPSGTSTSDASTSDTSTSSAWG